MQSLSRDGRPDEAVQVVAHDRMAQVRQVHPDLVRAACRGTGDTRALSRDKSIMSKPALCKAATVTDLCGASRAPALPRPHGQGPATWGP